MSALRGAPPPPRPRARRRVRAELADGEVITAPAAAPPQCPIVAMRILPGEEAQLVIEGADGVIPVHYVLRFSFE
jgi:hypothetical protein